MSDSSAISSTVGVLVLILLSSFFISNCGVMGLIPSAAVLLAGLMISYKKNLTAEVTEVFTQTFAKDANHEQKIVHPTNPEQRYGATKQTAAELPLTAETISLPQMNTLVNQSGPQLETPNFASTSALACASRDRSPDSWTPNFVGPDAQCNKEQWLEKIGTMGFQGSQQQSQAKLLPANCTTQNRACPLEVDWQASFKNCPSTHLSSPTCKIYERDDRLWHTDLNDLIQERAMLNGEIWDPYKHFNNRQLFAQFLAKDLVNRKDQHMRPISSIEESYCFGKAKAGIAGMDPDVPSKC